MVVSFLKQKEVLVLIMDFIFSRDAEEINKHSEMKALFEKQSW